MRGKEEVLAAVRANWRPEKPDGRVHYAGRVYDVEEVVAAVGSAYDFWLTLGREASLFEAEFAQYADRDYALMVNSGSSANLLAVASLCSPLLDNPLRSGDEVITPALTFPTTVAPLVQYGLVPVFVDVDPRTLNLDAGLLEAALSGKTRAVMLPHTLGNMADLDRMTQFCQDNGLFLIEDCCDALGSVWRGQQVGTFGIVSTTSFYPAHHMTAGEGGMVYSNDATVMRAARSLRDWGRDCWCATGVSNTCGKRFQQAFGSLPFGYDHKYVYSHVGYNLKPLDLQAAIARVQLTRLPGFHAARRSNYEYLYHALCDVPFLSFMEPLTFAEPSWFCFPITVGEGAPFSRLDLTTVLEKNKIETRVVFSGNITRHPGFCGINKRVSGSLDNTDKVMAQTFFVGVYPGLTSNDLNRIVSVITDFVEQR